MKISSVLCFAVCLLTVSCTYKKEAESVDTHKVIYPILEDVTYSNKYVAQIQSVNYVEIRSKIKGYIGKIYVDEGQPVKKGQLLFALTHNVFEKELQKANAAFRSAVADLKVTTPPNPCCFLEATQMMLPDALLLRLRKNRSITHLCVCMVINPDPSDSLDSLSKAASENSPVVTSKTGNQRRSVPKR